MKKLFERIVALKTEASNIQEELSEMFPNDDLLGTSLYQVEAACEETLGKVFIHLNDEGKLTFTDTPKGLLAEGAAR